MNKIFLFLAISALSTLSQAAGDPTKTLTASEAKSYLETYKGVLFVQNCKSLAPISGTISGGAGPFGGSETISLQLDGGATLVIENEWSKPAANGNYAHSKTTVSCVLADSATSK